MEFSKTKTADCHEGRLGSVIRGYYCECNERHKRPDIIELARRVISSERCGKAASERGVSFQETLDAAIFRINAWFFDTKLDELMMVFDRKQRHGQAVNVQDARGTSGGH